MATGSKLQRDLLAADIITGPPVYVRRKVYYTGHATTTYSVEQASTIIDFIGSKTGCDHCLPFAVRLVEGGEMIFIAEGMGNSRLLTYFRTSDLVAHFQYFWCNGIL